MKWIFYIALLMPLFWACSPVRESAGTSATRSMDTIDSTEFGILISDPYFDQWYEYHYSPARDYTNEYYRNKNWIAVTNWNEYFRAGKYSEVIDAYIEYQPSVDYGIDVNRELFWYFRYVREKYRIRL